jgi:hypothetical protein
VAKVHNEENRSLALGVQVITVDVEGKVGFAWE